MSQGDDVFVSTDAEKERATKRGVFRRKETKVGREKI